MKFVWGTSHPHVPFPSYLHLSCQVFWFLCPNPKSLAMRLILWMNGCWNICLCFTWTANCWTNETCGHWMRNQLVHIIYNLISALSANLCFTALGFGYLYFVGEKGGHNMFCLKMLSINKWFEILLFHLKKCTCLQILMELFLEHVHILNTVSFSMSKRAEPGEVNLLLTSMWTLMWVDIPLEKNQQMFQLNPNNDSVVQIIIS